MMAFVVAGDYPVASTPSAVVTADFNGDGKLDLASTSGYDSGSRVSIRLGNGAGGFGAARDFAAPGYDTPSAIFIADYNNDGKLDIAVSEYNSFSALLGNGDGSFQPAIRTYGVSMVAAGHFDNIGYVDAVVTWSDGDWATHVQVYSGNGQGGFSPGADTYYWGWSQMTAVDLNNDGGLDIATGEGLAFLYSQGILQYNWDQQPSLSGGVVAAGDFNGDLNADLIVAANDVAVLPGNGDGTFRPPSLYTTNSASHSAVATGDFNGDGKLDAIVADSEAATISAMLGNGDGTLRYGGAFATGNMPSSVAIGDFNRDGRPDVAVANGGSRNLTVLLNDGNWAGLPPTPLTISVSDATVTEGNTGTRAATFTVTLSRAAAVDVSVNYNTTNITAIQVNDYTATSGSLTIPAGQTSRTFTVVIKSDRVAEESETFRVNLSNPTNAPIADGEGIGTILDDEPKISIGDVTKVEGRNGQTAIFTFTVSLSGAYDQPVTVSFKTVDGTAKTANRDYAAKTGTLTFAPGEMTKTIAIEVKGDSKRETNEAFYVDLFNLSGNTLVSKKRGVGTIINDD